MKYNGTKNGDGVYQTIINQIPPHQTYIELFLGTGAIIRKKRPATKNIAVEIDPKTIKGFLKMNGGCDIEIINDCAIKYAKTLSGNTDIFIYADPPYPLGTRKSKSKLYRHEMTDKQHSDLLHTLLSIPAHICISSYQNPMYNSILKGWRVKNFKAMTRKGIAIETLYMNYDEPEMLHDYQFLGKDFIDRQRIKRKIEAMKRKLQSLPILERNAIISALKQR